MHFSGLSITIIKCGIFSNFPNDFFKLGLFKSLLFRPKTFEHVMHVILLCFQFNSLVVTGPAVLDLRYLNLFRLTLWIHCAIFSG